jgi:RNA polymerase sigma-70 factor (ECF subfamily)
VLVLRYYHDLSEAEIAGILDIPPGTVKSRAHAAVERLRVLVEMQA